MIMLATKYVVGTLRGNGCNCWKWCVPPSGGALSGGGPCVWKPNPATTGSLTRKFVSEYFNIYIFGSGVKQFE